MPEKLKKWKIELTHSDLTTTASLGTPNVVLESHNTAESNDIVEDDNDELPRLNVHQITEGHREFIDGELHMVDDEELRRRGVGDDVDENSLG